MYRTVAANSRPTFSYRAALLAWDELCGKEQDLKYIFSMMMLIHWEMSFVWTCSCPHSPPNKCVNWHLLKAKYSRFEYGRLESTVPLCVLDAETPLEVRVFKIFLWLTFRLNTAILPSMWQKTARLKYCTVCNYVMSGEFSTLRAT